MTAPLFAATAQRAAIHGGDVRGYNAGAMLLHWAIALCVLFQLAAGFAMSRLDSLPDALRFPLFQWHKTVGLLVLTLTLARIAWRLFNPPPPHAPMARAEALASHVVHALFYVLMLLVPLSGWILVSASPTAIPTFLFLSEHLPWPHLPLPAALHGEAGEAVAGTSHLLLAYLMAGLIVLHVAGALKHSLLDRQRSLSRILPASGLARQSTALLALPIAAALSAAFLFGGLAIGRSEALVPSPAPSLATAEPASAGGWVIDKSASTIRYAVPFSGKPIGGAVARWDASITFDPADPSAGSATVTLDAASLDIDEAFVRGNLAGADGLETAVHPTILVALDTFQAEGAGFVGRGTITAKGKVLPVALPFTFEALPDGGAHVVGEAEIDRLALGLGLQNDPTGKWLGTTVTVTIDLRASPAKTVDTGS